jgi:XTP/dITP diphosphohydrolase/tetrapyrrole methylase family protein/MazG family protein/ATP diphosphatase
VQERAEGGGQGQEGEGVAPAGLGGASGAAGARAPEDPAPSGDGVEAVARLDLLARRLRRECPWDREQDERSIVPHTVDEAYELADAAHSGDDAKLLDELGDVLFQVHFLALLLEERGAGDLAAVADGCRAKLIRRHPHVFGERRAEDAAEVRRNWDEIKRTQEGRGELFADVPENLPGPLYARKVQRRAAAAGHDVPDAEAALAEVERQAGELRAGAAGEEGFRLLGDLLFASVAAARKLSVDPELALRAAVDRFRSQVEEGEHA